MTHSTFGEFYNKLHVYLIFSLVFVIFNSTDNYFNTFAGYGTEVTVLLQKEGKIRQSYIST